MIILVETFFRLPAGTGSIRSAIQTEEKANLQAQTIQEFPRLSMRGVLAILNPVPGETVFPGNA
jgi:hypothetical protein